MEPPGRTVSAQVVVPLVVAVLTVAGATLGAVFGARWTTQGALELQLQAQTAAALAESGEAGCTYVDLLKIEEFGEFCSQGFGIPPGLTVQRELVRQLVEHPKQRREIIALWRAIYSADEWIDRIEAALDSE